ncbi:hypothetical protein Bbelb_135350 [Branchiostoma belcheri]|nr:hypothetical protein Bbelb_135350 [Branchiostoma belcheri]
MPAGNTELTHCSFTAISMDENGRPCWKALAYGISPEDTHKGTITLISRLLTSVIQGLRLAHGYIYVRVLHRKLGTSYIVKNSSGQVCVVCELSLLGTTAVVASQTYKAAKIPWQILLYIASVVSLVETRLTLFGEDAPVLAQGHQEQDQAADQMKAPHGLLLDTAIHVVVLHTRLSLPRSKLNQSHHLVLSVVQGSNLRVCSMEGR